MENLDKMVSHQQAKIELAAAYREMAQTAGFKDLQRELANRIADLKNKWMDADEVEAAKIKIRAKVYNEVLDIVKSKILQGDLARKTIEEAEQI